MNKTTAIIIGIIILCFGGFVTWSILSSESKTALLGEVDTASIIQPSDLNGNIGDHVRGNADSQTIFVEYADFQCPGCASFHPRVDNLLEEYGDRVAFVFRNFPIKDHPNARAAAAAAEAAGLQGYFFEMAEILYANQATWSYASGAERTGIFTDMFLRVFSGGDVDKFQSDMASSRVSQKITFDYELGKRDGVTGTPSFHVDGERVEFPKSASVETMMSILRDKINAQLAGSDLPADPAEE